MRECSSIIPVQFLEFLLHYHTLPKRITITHVSIFYFILFIQNGSGSLYRYQCAAKKTNKYNIVYIIIVYINISDNKTCRAFYTYYNIVGDFLRVVQNINSRKTNILHY